MSIATVLFSLSNGAQILLVGLYFDEMSQYQCNQFYFINKYTPRAQPGLKYSQCDIFFIFFLIFFPLIFQISDFAQPVVQIGEISPKKNVNNMNSVTSI